MSAVVEDPNRRGVSASDQAAAAHLAQQSLFAEQRNVRELLNYANNDHRTTITELQVIGGQLREVEVDLKSRGYTAQQIAEEPEVMSLRQLKSDIFKRLLEVKSKKRQLEVESEILMPKRRTQAASAFISRAGLPATQESPLATMGTPMNQTVSTSISFLSNSQRDMDDQSSMTGRSRPSLMPPMNSSYSARVLSFHLLA